MKKIELMKKEEEQSHKQFLAYLIADMIYIHYKHYKNKKFESYNQVYHSGMQFINYSEKEQEEIYKNVAIDNELDAKYAAEINNNIKLEPITKSNTNTVINTNETINNEALDLI